MFARTINDKDAIYEKGNPSWCHLVKYCQETPLLRGLEVIVSVHPLLSRVVKLLPSHQCGAKVRRAIRAIIPKRAYVKIAPARMAGAPILRQTFRSRFLRSE